jgi:hypothetical protein
MINFAHSVLFIYVIYIARDYVTLFYNNNNNNNNRLLLLLYYAAESNENLTNILPANLVRIPLVQLRHFRRVRNTVKNDS